MSDQKLWLMLVIAIVVTFLWRFSGVVIAGQLKPGSPIFIWVSCIAYGISAGLMMKLIISPAGTLAESDLMGRLSALSVAVVVFYATKRRIVWALLAGLVTFLLLSLQ